MKKKTNKIAMIIFSSIPLLMTIPLFVLGKTDIKYFLGEFAYCLFIFDVILGLRPEWIEKLIELKQVYFIHGIMAILAVIFSGLHVEMSHIDGISGLVGNMAFYGSILITILALLFLTNQFLGEIPIVRHIINMVRKVCSMFAVTRELNLLIHVLSPLIVVFIYLHVLFIPEFSQRPSFMMFFEGYFVFFVVAYLYYGVYRKLHVAKYKIETINRLNQNTYEISLNYVKGRRLKIKGGQFVFIQLPFAKMDEYHPFSLLENTEKGKHIKLGIKAVGDFTDKLAEVQPGTIAKIKGVYGHFTAPRGKAPVVAIAGGIGVTPCISLMQSLSEKRKGYLIWSIHSENDKVFENELQKLQKTHPNVKVIYHNSSQMGHLNAKQLRNEIPELDEHKMIDCFICGPAPMTKSVTKDLQRLGVKDKNIITEGFIF